MRRAFLAVGVVGVLVGACGASSMSGPGIIHGDDDDDGTTDAPPDTTPPGFVEIIGRDWSINPGHDFYECRKILVEQEMWISSFKTLSPQGTHHQIMTVSDNGDALGDSDCNAGILDPKMVYAGGIETGDLTLPDGVAVHIKAGQYLSLNIHLFDTTDGPISGHSGVLAKTIAAADVVHEADMTFAGTTNLNKTGVGNGTSIPRPPGVPHDNQTHIYYGGCTVPAGEDWNVFALWPHMHEIGNRMSLRINGGLPLFDQAYDFENQQILPPPSALVLHPGDQVTVGCSYLNDTPNHTNTGTQPVAWGDGANAEMCYLGMYRWPVVDTTSIYSCVSN